MTEAEIKARLSWVSEYLVDSGLKRDSMEWQRGMALCITRLLCEHAGYGGTLDARITAVLGNEAREVLNGC